MEPEQTTNTPPASPPPLDMTRMLKPGEVLLFTVRRHIIGIVYIYLAVLGAAVAITSIVYVAAPTLADNLSDEGYRLLLAGVIIAIALLIFILLIATYVYRLSMLIVTNKSLIQVVQSGLFVRKVSRFTISDVEDVTAEQRGILATIFNYGTLTVQTAGTQDNFLFSYCPDPNTYAVKIIEATHAFEEQED